MGKIQKRKELASAVKSFCGGGVDKGMYYRNMNEYKKHNGFTVHTKKETTEKRKRYRVNGNKEQQTM